MGYRLEITQADIDLANDLRAVARNTTSVFSSASMCPIAQALKRETGLQPYCDCSRLQLYGGEYPERTYLTTDAVFAFMRAWDKGKAVRPTSFDVEETP